MKIEKRSTPNTKRICFVVIILFVCLGIGIYMNVRYRNSKQIMFPEDSTAIMNEYQQEIQFIENYTGIVIDEINADTADYILTATHDFELNHLDTDLLFDDLNNSIVDAALEFKAYQMNSNVWYKPR